MIIKQARPEDLHGSALQEIGILMNEGFVEEGNGLIFNPDAFYDFWSVMLLRPTSSMFLLFNDNHKIIGLIAGLITTDPTTGKLNAAHINWRVGAGAQGNGRILLKALEGWASRSGAENLVVHLPCGLENKLEKEYDLMGAVFMKSLKEGTEK